MKIGVDISQTAYKSTGVANYLKDLVREMIKYSDGKDEYILFFSSLRGEIDREFIKEVMGENVRVKIYRLPPRLLDLLWNKMHIFPIENFIGDVDIFITSDWTEPPTKRAKKVTILYDLIVYKYPEETAQKIIATQKKKHAWMKKESEMIICISESTKKDAEQILKIPENKLHVIYPGLTL